MIKGNEHFVRRRSAITAMFGLAALFAVFITLYQVIHSQQEVGNLPPNAVTKVAPSNASSIVARAVHVDRVARFTCSSAGMPQIVAMCFVGNQNRTEGELAVRDGNSVKQYSQIDLQYDMAVGEKIIPLSDDWKMVVKANGSDALSLKVEIIENGNVASSQEFTGGATAVLGSDE